MEPPTLATTQRVEREKGTPIINHMQPHNLTKTAESGVAAGQNKTSEGQLGVPAWHGRVQPSTPGKAEVDETKGVL